VPARFIAPGAVLLTLLASISAAPAVECPRQDALGTSRVLAVDAKAFPRVGLTSFPQSLPLDDHEVVLTFDDGPWPATDDRVLTALADQCVRATFFLIGKPASEHPEWVKRIAAEGHSIGHHTWSHHNLKYMKPEEAQGEIDQGIAAVEMALHGVSTTVPSTPFFRYPHFEMTEATLDNLQKRGIVVFGADILADDWKTIDPAQEFKLVTERLSAAGKGIILLHDAEGATAAMLPDFLRYLRDNRYRIVHLVPAIPARGSEAAETK
jgi:peptidoglycan/xylan/chitin deacetylase (PgdA/CDA1 family)